MGQAPLEEKLKQELLSAEELTEARVVYMLVCVRKLMEIEGGKYSSLRFHCDWALHTRLDKKEAVKIIKLFDELEEALETGFASEIEKARQAVHAVTSAHNFRNELTSFLNDHRLPDDLCVTGNRWIRFLDVYVRIISDVPLEFNATPIRHIRKVVVKHVGESGLPEPYSADFVFGLEWAPERFDKKAAMPHGLNYQLHRSGNDS